MAEHEVQGEWTVPDGWVEATIGEIAAQINSGFPSGKHNTGGVGVPHLRPMNISPNGEIDLSLVKYVEVSDYDALQEGDVLFNNTNSPAWLGKTAYIKKDTNWAYSNHMTRIRLHRGFDSGWVAYALHHLFLTGFFRMNCRHHVNQASINTNFLSTQTAILVPPFPEQRRIVAEIETQFTRLDAGVAALKRARANLRRYRAAMLKAACEGRLVSIEAELARAEGRDYDPADQLLARILAERRAKWEAKHPGKKYKEPAPPYTEDLPDLPEGWVWTTTGQLCDCIVPNRDKPKSFTGDIPWITLPDFDENLTVIHSSKSGLGLTEEETKQYRARVIPGGSVVMSCVGRFGISAVVRQDAVVNQQLHAFIIPESLEAKYLVYAIKTQVPFMEKISTATTIAYLNKSKCNSVPVSLPPLAEQHRIVAEVERRLSVVAALEREVEAALARAGRLRQAVLKQAFEGRLVEQDPEDEPASVLLERIRATREAQATGGKKKKTRQMQLPTM